MSSELKNSIFFLIGNIPESFRSANLRSYFSQYVEKKSFSCFHYRHRPELVKQDGQGVLGETEATSLQSKGSRRVTSKCCVVAVKSKFGNDFLKMYQNKNWAHHDGSLLVGKVRINNLKVTPDQDSAEHKADFSSTSSIPWDDLASLPELNPPNVMPQGNVGTPLSTFMMLIRTCKLPGHLIKKLQLEFPKSRSSKRYGAVKFDYGGNVASFSEASAAMEGEGCVSEDSDSENAVDTVNEKIPSDDDHDAEEWERYEALHDDVDKQERTKERLFEEDLEVVWEKGGSGLVFYTDASHWDQQDGDFDEKCSQEDDWDVDMSVYYEQGGGSRDAVDMRSMEVERRLRGGEKMSECWREHGGFEKYTKGIGSKVLKRSGWVVGSGVGATNQGITEPVASDGQHPSNKKGLGYRGEKLNRYASSPKRRKAKDVIISTVYDKPEEEEDTVLRTAPPTVLKHRAMAARGKGVKFWKGGTLKADCDNTARNSETS